jgi:DNA polymerase-3 subunit beta
MKFTVSQSSFQSALSSVSRLTSGKITYPQLAAVKIEADNNLTLSTTDLETYMQITIPCQIEEPGIVCVQAKSLLNLVKKLQGEIQIDQQDDLLHIRYGNKGNVKLTTIDAAEYPVIPEVDGDNFTLPGDAWKSHISKVLFAAAPQEIRPNCAGVYAEILPDRVRITATDSYRLCHDRIDLETDCEANLLIPGKLLQEVNRMVDDEPLTVVWQDSMIKFSTSSWEIIGRLMDSAFPDYRRVIPPEVDHPLVIDRDALKKTLSRAALFSDGTQQAVVTFNASGNELVIDAENRGESLREVLAIEEIPESVSGMFTVAYLLEPLGCLGQKARLDVAGEKPGVYRDGCFLGLVLPVRRIGTEQS